MFLPRRALPVAGTVIALLGIGTVGSVAGVRPASGTRTWTGANVSLAANADRSHTEAAGAGRATTSPSISQPWDITTGPDGALWFTNFENNTIGRITTSGTITSYTGPGISEPYGITAGPDGALWFTNYLGDSIGRITTSGTVTNYTDPSITSPEGITAGSDGALWFTNYVGASIGRITTSGTVTNYTGIGIDHPEGITAGSDGALWFTNIGGSTIGRITTSGAVTNYTDPSLYDPWAITAGPDGALWFTNRSINSIGRITTSGTITTYTDPTISSPHGITAGPDGALWFTNNGSSTIGRITTSGTVTSYGRLASATTIAATPNPSSYGQPVTFTATVSPIDGGGTVAFSADGNPIPGCSSQSLSLVSGSTYQATCTTSALAGGSHVIEAGYGGDANYSDSSATVTQTVTRQTTATTLTSGPNPSVYGQPVTFTATVSPIDGGGTVAFSADGNPISGCSSQSLSLVSGSSYRATCTTSALAGGSHVVEATYSGDTGYASSSATITQTVNPNPTATTLSSSPNPSVYGQAVTFTATVSPTDGQGKVSFSRGTGTNKTALCPDQSLTLVGGSYQARCTISSLSAATYTITAAYSGDADYGGSAAMMQQTVNKTPTTTAVSSSKNPSLYSHSVTFTATVSPSDGAGTVTFWYAGNTIAGCTSKPLQNNTGSYQATCTTSSLPAGTDKVKAVYSGDKNCFGSTGTVTQVVNRIATKTTLRSSPNPSISGQVVTLTATTSPSDGGGTVGFSSNGHAISGCSAKTLTLVGSSYQAVCKTSALPRGTDKVKAAYSGDAKYRASSGTVTQQVN